MGRTLEYVICKSCYGSNEIERYNEAVMLSDEKEAKEAKKQAQAAKRRENYYKPENIEKRRLKKEQKAIEMQEVRKKHLESLKNEVSGFFKKINL